MRRFLKATIAGVLVAGLTGCAAQIGSAINMQVHKARIRGEPVDKFVDYFGREIAVATVLNGNPAYTWNASYTEARTVEVDSYAYHNQDRPGMTTGIVYGTRTFDRDCKLTIAYDESTRLVTDLELTNEFECTLVRAELAKIQPVWGF